MRVFRGVRTRASLMTSSPLARRSLSGSMLPLVVSAKPRRALRKRTESPAADKGGGLKGIRGCPSYKGLEASRMLGEKHVACPYLGAVLWNPAAGWAMCWQRLTSAQRSGIIMVVGRWLIRADARWS